MPQGGLVASGDVCIVAATSASSGCPGEGQCQLLSAQTLPAPPDSLLYVLQRNPIPKSPLRDPDISTGPKSGTLMGEMWGEECVGAPGAEPRANGQQLWAELQAAGRGGPLGWLGASGDVGPGWRGPPPVLLGGTKGYVLLLQARWFGELPGLEERAAWGRARMRMDGGSGCCERDRPGPGGGGGQGQRGWL